MSTDSNQIMNLGTEALRESQSQGEFQQTHKWELKANQIISSSKRIGSQDSFVNPKTNNQSYKIIEQNPSLNPYICNNNILKCPEAFEQNGFKMKSVDKNNILNEKTVKLVFLTARKINYKAVQDNLIPILKFFLRRLCELEQSISLSKKFLQQMDDIKRLINLYEFQLWRFEDMYCGRLNQQIFQKTDECLLTVQVKLMDLENEVNAQFREYTSVTNVLKDHKCKYLGPFKEQIREKISQYFLKTSKNEKKIVLRLKQALQGENRVYEKIKVSVSRLLPQVYLFCLNQNGSELNVQFYTTNDFKEAEKTLSSLIPKQQNVLWSIFSKLACRKGSKLEDIDREIEELKDDDGIVSIDFKNQEIKTSDIQEFIISPLSIQRQQCQDQNKDQVNSNTVDTTGIEGHLSNTKGNSDDQEMILTESVQLRTEE